VTKDKAENSVLEAVDYQPLEGGITQRRGPIAAGLWTLSIVLVGSALVMLYLTMARAVIVSVTPASSEIAVSGLAFSIGGNFLLLPGDYEVAASAPGYRPSTRSLTVDDSVGQEVAIALEPLPGDLIINSALDALSATLDGQPMPQDLPGTIPEISRGIHQLVISRARYFDASYDVDMVGLGTQQSLDVALKPAWGHLTLDSQPSGAQLLVDGQALGATPARAEILATGSQVELSKPGYNSWIGELSADAGSSAIHPTIELLIADGRVLIDSQPSGASVTLDDRFEGLTPIEVEVRPDREHRVELFLDGYLKAQRSFSVAPEAKITLAITLAENIGEIALNVSPEDAEVLVDGQSIGRGDQKLRLPAKGHRLQVRRQGYTSATRDILPKPGQQQALNVALLTEEATYWASRPARISAFGNINMALMRPQAPFKMGAPRREPGRRANEVERAVVLKRPFYLGVNEVSNRQFRLWRAEHSSSAISAQTLDMQEQPVAMVSWQDAARFCNWLSERDDLKPFYQLQNDRVDGHNWNANGYRLPTEAEWSWAARVADDGSTAMFGWNNNRYPPSDVMANYADASAAKFVRFTLPNYRDPYPVSSVVGSFKANRRGLYNLYGNVAEWTNDFYDMQPHRGTPLTDPHGPENGVRRVVRGASWALGSRSELRVAYRDNASDARLDVGFRIARYVDSVETTP